MLRCPKGKQPHPYPLRVGRNSIVGIATYYAVGDSRFEFHWGRIYRPDRPCNTPSFLYSRDRVVPGIKRQDRGVNLPPRLAQRLKKEQNLTSILPLQGDLYFFVRFIPDKGQVLQFEVYKHSVTTFALKFL